ncbi:MAG: fatty acid desaturase CarF family protein [Acidimicrobiia bacterium]
MSGRTAGHGVRALGRYDYPTKYRAFEVSSLAAFVVFGLVFWVRVGGAAVDRFTASVALGLLGAVALAYFTADFLSGLVHFLCDTYGSTTTPVLGQKFIKAFREHHDDPMKMTRGDFVEVNADNFFVCLPVLIPCVIWLDVHDHLYLAVFLSVLMAFVVVTNELHKWAHMPDVPPLMQRLQATGLVLSPANHGKHHTAPYVNSYCITAGVLNPLLDRLGLWRLLGSQRAANGSALSRPQ